MIVWFTICRNNLKYLKIFFSLGSFPTVRDITFLPQTVVRSVGMQFLNMKTGFEVSECAFRRRNWFPNCRKTVLRDENRNPRRRNAIFRLKTGIRSLGK